MPKIFEREYTFTSADGKTPIHVHEWEPDCDINGVVQIAHGIAEYIERYADFARMLASKGFYVVGNDHLGHGRSVLSPDDLGYFADEDGWQKVISDMKTLRDLTGKKVPDAPYFLFGHSMGSFLTRAYLIRFPYDRLSGAILSGTGQNPLPVLLGGCALCDVEAHRNGKHYRSQLVNNVAFGAYNKSFEPRRTDFDWLSRDEANVDKYIADPLCGFVASVGLYRDMMGGLISIGNQANLESMDKDMPVYFMSGTKDPVGDNGAGVAKVYGMFLKAGMNDVYYKFYKDGRHEMLNEINRDEVYKDILDWLFKKIG